ncbi:MAG: lysophospholipid acyltransferase family protein [Deltaproteobacteria bacterium]|nr:lysophospholipid acyltransferase family protein [Deltaproteobacteria bacterium]
MNIGSRIAWLAMKGTVGAASLLPLPALFASFRALAAAFRALGIRRRVVRENLRAAFGKELGEREREDIERNCYAEYGRIVSEVIASDRILREKQERFELLGLSILEEAVRDRKGLLILTGHLGNFIVGAHCLRSMGFPMSVVAKRVANEYVNREIEKVYCRGAAIISVRGFKNDPQGGLKLFRGLKRGDIVIALVDQDAGPEGFRSDFFGLPTYLPAGPARFAHRAGVAVATGFATREGGRIRVEIQPPIDYSSAGTPEEAEKIILDEYSRRLEEKVRKAPEQYFWFHKKWKALPEIRARYEGKETV